MEIGERPGCRGPEKSHETGWPGSRAQARKPGWGGSFAAWYKHFISGAAGRVPRLGGCALPEGGPLVLQFIFPRV